MNNCQLPARRRSTLSITMFAVLTLILLAGVDRVQAQTPQWTPNSNNTITTTGNVGIGTASPGAKLDVNGTAKVNGVPVDPSIRWDDGVYFRAQPYFEAGTFPFSILGGTAPTFTTLNNTSIPFSKVAVSNYLEFISDYIPVQAGETLYGEIWAMRQTGSTGVAGFFYMGVAQYDKDKNPVASNTGLSYFVASGVTVPQNSTWTKHSGKITLATSHTPYNGSDGGPVRYVRPYIIVNYSTGTIPTYWGGAIVRRVAPFRGTGDVSFDGNVGIGTTSPGSKLTVRKDDAATSGVMNPLLVLSNQTYTVNTGASLGFEFADGVVGASITGISSQSSGGGSLFLSTRNNFGNYAEHMRITSDGNVGIGTTSPTQKLEVNGNMKMTGRWIVPSSGAWGGDYFEVHAGGWDGSSNSNYGGVIGGHAYFYGGLQTGGPSGGEANSGELYVAGKSMLLGNVGIGTTGPGYRLDVQGGQINSSGGLCIAGICKTDWSQVGGSQWTTSGSNVYYNTGNVGIGTTTPAAALSFGNLNDGRNTADGITWYNPSPTAYGIYRSAGPWSAPNYQQLTLGWSTGVVIDGGTAYGRSGTVLQPNGGNVGIGTASPTAKLDVNGTALTRDTLTVKAGAGNEVAKLTWLSTDDGQLNLRSANTVTVQLNTNSSSFLNGGNVGIGTTAPGYKLDVAGTAGLGQAYLTNSDLYFTSTGHNHTGIGNTSGYAAIENAANFNTLMILGRSGGIGGVRSVSIWDRLDVNGNLNTTGTITGGTIHATYQDVAEWVESSQTLPAGTVVVLDHTKSNQVIASSKAYDTRVAGVISARPGITLGEQGDAKVLVATTGRVKVKVDATAAPIQVGDLLVTSDKEGVAMRSLPINVGGVQLHRPGTLIGKALEPLAKGEGEILVLLSLQ